MVIKANKFTPEVLLSAPRRGPAVPNHDGTLALYSVSTYSFQDHSTLKEIRILDIKTGNSTQFSNDENAHDANWLGDGTNAIIWLQSGDKGITNIMIGDANEPTKASYIADCIWAPFSNLKLKPLADGTIACVMSGLATPTGSLYNELTNEKSPSTARIYDKLYVRFWDKYSTPQRTVLWYSKLSKSDGKYSLAAPVHNALKYTDLECPFYNPSGSESNDFDISSTGLIFSAWDTTENPARNQKGQRSVYFVPLTTFIEEVAPRPQRITTGNYDGSTSNPRFSPSGKKATFLISPDKYSDGSCQCLMFCDFKALHAVDLLKFARGDPWHLFPTSVEFSRDGNSLLVTADDCGRFALYILALKSHARFPPKLLTEKGSVDAFYPLGASGEKLLVSSTSLVENSLYSIIDCGEPENAIEVSSSSSHGSKLGISSKQVSEMYFEGGGNYCVQAFVVKPSFFDERKKYPLALLMHGGPEDAWRDAWSTRWNPAVWAEQGYICVMPNITGSTGFGLEFTEGIYDSWGGRPYDDLVNCFEYVKKNMPFVDTDNAIAAGGSYGGYLANWLQGNPLGRKFKAIVCHDGVFNLQSLMTSDEILGNSDFNGPQLPWKNYHNLEKWNPARPELLAQWKTPMLVIHSDKDYRCPIEGGIAAFAVLQYSGIPSRYLNFPDENHWVLKPENSLVWHETVFDWINKYSGVAQKRELEKVNNELSTQIRHCVV